MKTANIRIIKVKNFPKYSEASDTYYRVLVKIMPKGKSNISNLVISEKNQKEFLLAPAPLYFNFENYDSSSILFKFFYGDFHFANLKLPFTWFQKNSIVTESFPARYIQNLPNTKTMMVKISVHISEINQTPFSAPIGQLLVYPSWKNKPNQNEKSIQNNELETNNPSNSLNEKPNSNDNDQLDSNYLQDPPFTISKQDINSNVNNQAENQNQANSDANYELPEYPKPPELTQKSNQSSSTESNQNQQSIPNPMAMYYQYEQPNPNSYPTLLQTSTEPEIHSNETNQSQPIINDELNLNQQNQISTNKTEINNDEIGLDNLGFAQDSDNDDLNENHEYQSQFQLPQIAPSLNQSQNHHVAHLQISQPLIQQYISSQNEIPSVEHPPTQAQIPIQSQSYLPPIPQQQPYQSPPIHQQGMNQPQQYQQPIQSQPSIPQLYQMPIQSTPPVQQQPYQNPIQQQLPNPSQQQPYQMPIQSPPPVQQQLQNPSQPYHIPIQPTPTVQQQPYQNPVQQHQQLPNPPQRQSANQQQPYQMPIQSHPPVQQQQYQNPAHQQSAIQQPYQTPVQSLSLIQQQIQSPFQPIYSQPIPQPQQSYQILQNKQLGTPQVQYPINQQIPPSQNMPNQSKSSPNQSTQYVQSSQPLKKQPSYRNKKEENHYIYPPFPAMNQPIQSQQIQQPIQYQIPINQYQYIQPSLNQIPFQPPASYSPSINVYNNQLNRQQQYQIQMNQQQSKYPPYPVTFVQQPYLPPQTYYIQQPQYVPQNPYNVQPVSSSKKADESKQTTKRPKQKQYEITPLPPNMPTKVAIPPPVSFDPNNKITRNSRKIEMAKYQQKKNSTQLTSTTSSINYDPTHVSTSMLENDEQQYDSIPYQMPSIGNDGFDKDSSVKQLYIPTPAIPGRYTQSSKTQLMSDQDHGNYFLPQYPSD